MATTTQTTISTVLITLVLTFATQCERTDKEAPGASPTTKDQAAKAAAFPADATTTATKKDDAGWPESSDPPYVPKKAEELGADISDDPAMVALIKELDNVHMGGKVMKELFAKKSKKKKALQALRKAVTCGVPNIQSQAAKILVLDKDVCKETTEAFIEVITKEPDDDVRANVLSYLKKYKDKDLVPYLLEALEKDEAKMVRAHAAGALGKYKSKKTIAALVAALDDEESWVRLMSVGALKRMNAKQAADKVVELVKDENIRVKERAIEAMEKFTGKQYGDDYDKWKKLF